MLVSPNNEMAAILVSRSNPPGIESYHYANTFSLKNMAVDHVSETQEYVIAWSRLHKRNPLYLYKFIAVNLTSSIPTTCSNPKVVGSIPTLVRVFLCPWVGPFPLVGLTLTWFTWVENSTWHYPLIVNSVEI